MKSKLSIAAAAIVLGLQIGAPATAQVTPADMDRAEAMVQAGDVVGFRDFLAANPDLLSLPGVLGNAIRAFAAAPNAATLAAVSAVSASTGISVASVASDTAASIY